MNQVCLKVMPAIASGCTMVLKPSELAPLSSMILAELIDESKIPAGVFNLVNGDGATTGDALTSHPDVNMISFTGSTRAGALISQNAAKDFKRVSLELGGKGANIIFKGEAEVTQRKCRGQIKRVSGLGEGDARKHDPETYRLGNHCGATRGEGGRSEEPLCIYRSAT